MRSTEIILKPIGIVHTPYHDVTDGVPIQGRLSPQTEGKVEVFPEYREACRDLEGFSHIILVYHFHKSIIERLVARPYMDTEIRGMFSIRSPHRPNHLGITLVELLKCGEGILEVRGVDMIEGTPLLDIKPYSPVFDTPGPGAPVRIGWMSKYMSGELKPKTLQTKSHDEWLNKEKADE